MSPRASETSSHYNVHRAASTAVRTFLVVLLAGTLVTLTSTPTYRCSVKLFLENAGDRPPMLDPANPLSAMFGSPVTTIADQIQMITGDKVVADACNDADVPP